MSNFYFTKVGLLHGLSKAYNKKANIFAKFNVNKISSI